MAKNIDDIMEKLEKIEAMLTKKEETKEDALETFFKAAASKQASDNQVSDKKYEFILRDTHGNLHIPTRMSENDIMKFVYDACC